MEELDQVKTLLKYLVVLVIQFRIQIFDEAQKDFNLPKILKILNPFWDEDIFLNGLSTKYLKKNKQILISLALLAVYYFFSH